MLRPNFRHAAICSALPTTVNMADKGVTSLPWRLLSAFCRYISVMVASNQRSTCDPETPTPARHRVGGLRLISVYRVILEAAGRDRQLRWPYFKRSTSTFDRTSTRTKGSPPSSRTSMVRLIWVSPLNPFRIISTAKFLAFVSASCRLSHTSPSSSWRLVPLSSISNDIVASFQNAEHVPRLFPDRLF